MFPRQRPRGLNPKEIADWRHSKMEWYKSNQPIVAHWPWSILRMFQKEYGINQTGTRELQNQRVEAFLKNAFVSTREIAKHKELPAFIRFPFVLKTKATMFEECSILHIHKDVLKTKIIGNLANDPRDVFSLMMTCKSLQGLCQEMLCFLAQQRFGPQGTPKALMITTYYDQQQNKKEEKVEEERPTKRRALVTKKSLEELKKQVGLTGRDFKIRQMDNIEVDELVRLSIKKYGLIDNLKEVHANEAKKKAYYEQERQYVLEKSQGRLRQVNEKLQTAGYIGMDMYICSETQTCKWRNPRVLIILATFENGLEYKFTRYLKDATDWVYMKTDSPLGLPPSVEPQLFNKCLNAMGETAQIHPLAHFVVQALIEIKYRNYSFYGEVMTEEEWKERVCHVFCPKFLQTNPLPNRNDNTSLQNRQANDRLNLLGSWVCCWTRTSHVVRLICLSEQMSYQTASYQGWMHRFENKFVVNLALPATGIQYTFTVPRYIVQGGNVISLAHSLLTKKIF